MAVRGENIGTAYIRVISDGRGLDKSIRDDLDDINWDAVTRKSTGAFAESWRKEMGKAPNQAKLRSAIAQPLERGDWLTQTFFRGTNWRNFRSGMEKEYGDVGKRAAESLERQLLDGMSMARLDAQLQNLTPLLSKIRRDMAKEAEESARVLTTSNRKATNAHAEQRRALRSLREEYSRLSDVIDDFSKGIDVKRPRKDLLADLRRLQVEARRAEGTTYDMEHGLERMEKRLIFVHPNLEKTNRRITVFSNLMGRSFGAGSRSEFLNVIGRMTGAFARFPLLFTKSAAALSTWTKRISMATGITGKLAAAFGPLAASAAAFGVALGVAAVAIGPIVAALNLAVGALVALSSTIAFSTVGAVGALAGSFTPVVVGIGVMVAAFRNAPKEAKKSLRDLRAEFDGLGKAAGESVFRNAPEQVSRFRAALTSLEPVTRAIGRALSGVGDYFLDALESRGFRQFRRAMEAFLPNAVGSLGRTLVNTFAGFGGVMRGLIPITNRFLGWLERITGEFRNWANSRRGQEEIKSLMDRAADSAKALGGFLKSAGRLLGTLLSGGRDAGDSLFGSMSRAIDGWNRALQRDPDILRRYFNDAVDFARAVGNVVTAVGRLFDALDNGFNRGVVINGFRFLGEGLKGLNFLLQQPINLLRALGDGLSRLAQIKLPFSDVRPFAAFEGVGKALSGIGEANRKAFEPRFADSLRGSLDQVTGAATRATRELIKTKLAQDGNLGAANQLGISTRDLIDATLGNASAQGRVARALAESKNGFDYFTKANIRDAVKRLGEQFGMTGAEIRESNRDLTSWREALRGLGKNSKLKLAVQTVGMSPTLREMRNLRKQYDLTPKQLRIIAKANGFDLTRANLKKIMGDVDKVNRTPAVAKTRAVPGPALAGLKSVEREVDRLHRKTARPTVGTRGTGQAIGEVNALKRAIDALRDKTVTIRQQSIRTGRGPVAGVTATGGTFGYEQIRKIAEAGPEAVVPLNRPLGQVDPSVRWLSAIAQGKIPGMAAGGVVGASKTVNVGGITVVTPTKDPRAVAVEAMNHLTATMY